MLTELLPRFCFPTGNGCLFPVHCVIIPLTDPTVKRRSAIKTKNLATGFAILAAALYAVNVPLSKLLLNHVQPTMMAALLYLGAGVGMLLYSLIGKALGQTTIKEPLTKKELPYTVAPFLGVAFSMLLLGERPGLQFWAAVVIMVAATVLMVKDTVTLQHTHEHRHGDLVHTHEHSHEHTHIHTHGQQEESHTHKHGNLSGHDHSHADLSGSGA